MDWPPAANKLQSMHILGQCHTDAARLWLGSFSNHRHSLKHVLNRELSNPGRESLGKNSAAGPGGVLRIGGIHKIGAIEYVEELASDLDFVPFLEAEYLEKRGVQIGISRTGNNVTARITVCFDGIRECVLVEPTIGSPFTGR